jgi:hypothetical protein
MTKGRLSQAIASEDISSTACIYVFVFSDCVQEEVRRCVPIGSRKRKGRARSRERERGQNEPKCLSVFEFDLDELIFILMASLMESQCEPCASQFAIFVRFVLNSAFSSLLFHCVIRFEFKKRRRKNQKTRKKGVKHRAAQALHLVGDFRPKKLINKKGNFIVLDDKSWEEVGKRADRCSEEKERMWFARYGTRAGMTKNIK